MIKVYAVYFRTDSEKDTGTVTWWPVGQTGSIWRDDSEARRHAEEYYLWAKQVRPHSRMFYIELPDETQAREIYQRLLDACRFDTEEGMTIQRWDGEPGPRTPEEIREFFVSHRLGEIKDFVETNTSMRVTAGIFSMAQEIKHLREVNELLVNGDIDTWKTAVGQ